MFGQARKKNKHNCDLRRGSKYVQTEVLLRSNETLTLMTEWEKHQFRVGAFIDLSHVSLLLLHANRLYAITNSFVLMKYARIYYNKLLYY